MPPFICATLSSRTSQLMYGPTKITPAPSCDGEYKCVPQPDTSSTPPLPNTQAHTHIQTQIFTLPPARPPTFQRVERSALVRLEANIRNSLLLYRRGCQYFSPSGCHQKLTHHYLPESALSARGPAVNSKHQHHISVSSTPQISIIDTTHQRHRHPAPYITRGWRTAFHNYRGGPTTFDDVNNGRVWKVKQAQP